MDYDFPSSVFKSDLGQGQNDHLRQAMFLAAMAADWAHTRSRAKQGLSEMSPIARKVIGNHPSTGSVNNYFGLLGGLNSIPAGNRPWTPYGGPGGGPGGGWEDEVVGKSFNLGIGMNF